MRPSFKFKSSLSKLPYVETASLRSRFDEMLIAAAVLGLVATLVDGEADASEVDHFVLEFRKAFSLSKHHSNKLVSIALQRIVSSSEEHLIDLSCGILNQYLESTHKIKLLEFLSEVHKADGVVHESEEYYLRYVASELRIIDHPKAAYGQLT